MQTCIQKVKGNSQPCTQTSMDLFLHKVYQQHINLCQKWGERGSLNDGRFKRTSHVIPGANPGSFCLVTHGLQTRICCVVLDSRVRNETRKVWLYIIHQTCRLHTVQRRWKIQINSRAHVSALTEVCSKSQSAT